MDPSSFITTGGEAGQDLTGAWETINEQEGTEYEGISFTEPTFPSFTN